MDDSPAPFIVFKPVTPNAYRLALELVGHVHDVLEVADSTRFHLKDRLDRTTTAIAMALAHLEDDVPSARWRGYRTALERVIDCSTMLDIMARQGCTALGSIASAREIVDKLQVELAPLAFRAK